MIEARLIGEMSATQMFSVVDVLLDAWRILANQVGDMQEQITNLQRHNTELIERGRAAESNCTRLQNELGKEHEARRQAERALRSARRAKGKSS